MAEHRYPNCRCCGPSTPSIISCAQCIDDIRPAQIKVTWPSITLTDPDITYRHECYGSLNNIVLDGVDCVPPGDFLILDRLGISSGFSECPVVNTTACQYYTIIDCTLRINCENLSGGSSSILYVDGKVAVVYRRTSIGSTLIVSGMYFPSSNELFGAITECTGDPFTPADPDGWWTFPGGGGWAYRLTPLPPEPGDVDCFEPLELNDFAPCSIYTAGYTFNGCPTVGPA